MTNSATQYPYNYPIKGCFIVQNIITDSNKCIRIFDYPIPVGTTRDLLRIPGIDEAEIRASLLKGTLRNKLLVGEIRVICSDIDLLQFNDDQKTFLQVSGIVNGLSVSGGTGGFDVQDAALIGVQNNVNTTFTTSTKFKHTSQFKEVLFVNGLRQHIPEDYFVAESGGLGTRYDTIVFVIPPFSDDILTIDYFNV